MSDDQGWKDVGFHGSDIKTPNIDRLAETGVKFDQFYVEPMCTPSRAALLTGRYPMRYGLQNWRHSVGRQIRTGPREGYDTTLFGAEAVRVISGHDTKRPLFLYLAFTAPHTPYRAPKEFLDKYANIPDLQRRTYAAQITAMDDQIGLVVHSDNGGTRSAQFAGESAVKGELPPNNGPYRDGKGSTYEGGTRVCATMNWPGHIAPGTVTGLVHIVDMYPTLANLAHAGLAKNKPLDGIDVWGHIAQQKPAPREEMLYNLEPTGAALRQGDWKLVWLSILPVKVELFDLAHDPSEANNLAEKNPEQVINMQKRVAEYAREMPSRCFSRR